MKRLIHATSRMCHLTGRADFKPVVGWVLPLAAGLFMGLAAWLYLSFFSTKPVKVERLALQMKDGRWYYKEQTNLFTGLLVENYTTGGPKFRAFMENGLPHGLSEGWHTNGQMQVRELFINGVSDGLRTKWYPSGAKLSEAEIRSGKLHGKFRRWHEDGSLAEEMDMVNGEPDGVAYAFHPSGYVKAIASLKSGELTERKEFADGTYKRDRLAQVSVAVK